MMTSSPHIVINIEESEIECSRLKHSRLYIQMVIEQNISRPSDTELIIST